MWRIIMAYNPEKIAEWRRARGNDD